MGRATVGIFQTNLSGTEFEQTPNLLFECADMANVSVRLGGNHSTALLAINGSFQSHIEFHSEPSTDSAVYLFDDTRDEWTFDNGQYVCGTRRLTLLLGVNHGIFGGYGVAFTQFDCPQVACQ